MANVNKTLSARDRFGDVIEIEITETLVWIRVTQYANPERPQVGVVELSRTGGAEFFAQVHDYAAGLTDGIHVVDEYGEEIN